MFVHYIISLLGRGLPRRLIQHVKERLLLFGPVACPNAHGALIFCGCCT